VVYRGTEASRHRVRPDLSGTVMPGQNVTLVRWLIPANGPLTKMHSHDVHEQFTIVVSGSVETVVGDEHLVLNPGDVCALVR
jgi:quercetin dioxygenase-like cupin family protein